MQCIRSFVLKCLIKWTCTCAMHLLLGTMYATRPIRFIDWQYVSRCAACHHHLIDGDGCSARHTVHTPYTLVQPKNAKRERMQHTSDVWYHRIELTCETIRITAMINACVRMLASFLHSLFFQLDQIIWIIILLLQSLSKPIDKCTWNFTHTDWQRANVSVPCNRIDVL